MPASAALTIWIASSQIASPVTGAIARAAGEILGPSITVRTAAYPDGHPESARPPAGEERSVQVSWASASFEGAHLRLCRAADDCFERWVSFGAEDPELERGRTVGFLAAAVFLENAPQPEAPPPAPSPATPAREPLQTKPVVERKGSVSAAASVAAPGDGTTVGARLAAGYAVAKSLRLGVAGEGRVGEVSAAQATSRIVALQLFGSLVVARPTPALWLGVELGLGAHQLSISHLSSDDPTPNRKSRWLFGGDLVGEVRLNLNEFSAAFLEPGVEVLSGKTEIDVHERTVATWPVAIPIVRLGLRAAF